MNYATAQEQKQAGRQDETGIKSAQKTLGQHDFDAKRRALSLTAPGRASTQQPLMQVQHADRRSRGRCVRVCVLSRSERI